MPRRPALPKFCVEDQDRHGNWRVYIRRNGRKIRLHETPWSEAFMAERQVALKKLEAPPAPDQPDGLRIVPNTWRWLCVQFLSRCAAFKALDVQTREAYRRSLEGTYDEPISPDSNLTFATVPLAKFTTKAAKVLRDRKADAPQAGNARVKAMRAVFRFAVEDDLATTNPAAQVPYIKTGSTGHHTWTPAEFRQFEAKHPIGTKARLALALIAYTGVRRSDATRLGRQHIVMVPRKLPSGEILQDEWFKFVQHKNRNRKPIVAEFPILPDLRRVLDASPTGDLLFLTAKGKKAYSDTGFSNRFKDWCVEAGLRHCSAHGVRKAAATIAAENGATEWQMMSIFGWVDPKQAALYTKAASRKKMAGAAMALITSEETGYKEVPLLAKVSNGGTKSG